MARLRHWRKAWVGIIGLIGVCVLGVTAGFAQGNYPARQGTYINDYARLLDAQTTSSIQGMLTELQRNDGIEMSVLTINSINDYSTGDSTIESFSTHVFNRWGLGNATTNKGVLMVVAVKDRKVRIELGAGYDSTYDSKAQGVIDEFILPAFRGEDYVKGIDKGVKGTIHALTGNWPPGGEPSILDDPNLSGVLGVSGLIGLGLLGYGLYYYNTHKCPQCGKVNLYIASNVLQYPTYTSEGEKEITRECGNCGFHDTRVVAIGMLTQSSDSDSGSSYSSGSSSSSGGHSDGGGASGSW
jgi:uncharacterized protein